MNDIADSQENVDSDKHIDDAFFALDEEKILQRISVDIEGIRPNRYSLAPTREIVYAWFQS